MSESKAKELAQKIVSRDIVNHRGLFHILEAKADYSDYHKAWRIEAKCSIASHKICADNLVNGTQAMGVNVFMLTLEEAEKLIKPVKTKKVMSSPKRVAFKDIPDDLPF